MFCSKCGKEIMDEAVICPHCGCSTKNTVSNAIDPEDAPSFGFATLGFFIPIVGLILGISLGGRSPLRARSSRLGAIFGVVFYIFVSAALGLNY